VLEVGEDEGGAGDVAGFRFGQVRGALCQHGDDLVEVPVDVTGEMPWSRASPLGQPGAARRSRAGVLRASSRGGCANCPTGWAD